MTIAWAVPAASAAVGEQDYSSRFFRPDEIAFQR
jgi:hypothetical protein